MQVEALVQVNGRAKQGAGFPVFGRAAEPMVYATGACTMLKAASPWVIGKFAENAR